MRNVPPGHAPSPLLFFASPPPPRPPSPPPPPTRSLPPPAVSPPKKTYHIKMNPFSCSLRTGRLWMCQSASWE